MARIDESDWKTFKQLQPVALERLSQRILDEIQDLCRDDSRSPHERYLDIYGVVRDRDKDIADAFNQFSRSSAFTGLLVMVRLDLLRQDELERFRTDVQDSLRRLT